MCGSDRYRRGSAQCNLLSGWVRPLQVCFSAKLSTFWVGPIIIGLGLLSATYILGGSDHCRPGFAQCYRHSMWVRPLQAWVCSVLPTFLVGQTIIGLGLLSATYILGGSDHYRPGFAQSYLHSMWVRPLQSWVCSLLTTFLLVWVSSGLSLFTVDTTH